jgi:hypothetical protein
MLCLLQGLAYVACKIHLAVLEWEQISWIRFNPWQTPEGILRSECYLLFTHVQHT